MPVKLDPWQNIKAVSWGGSPDFIVIRSEWVMAMNGYYGPGAEMIEPRSGSVVVSAAFAGSSFDEDPGLPTLYGQINHPFFYGRSVSDGGTWRSAIFYDLRLLKSEYPAATEMQARIWNEVDDIAGYSSYPYRIDVTMYSGAALEYTEAYDESAGFFADWVVAGGRIIGQRSYNRSASFNEPEALTLEGIMTVNLKSGVISF